MLPAARVSLFRTRLFLEEGHSRSALGVLETVQSQEKVIRDDVAYLQGWCFIQYGRWADAIAVLSPFLHEEQLQDSELEPLSDRERHIINLLHLGQVAVKLAHYDDALTHFTLCLKMLRDRRVHLPLIRIRAHVSLAVAYIMRRSCSRAIQQYEEARRLSTFYSISEELPTIYYGLCEANRILADFSGAYSTGMEALRLIQEQGNELLEARIRNMLGFVSVHLADNDEADKHYMQSLRLAEELQRPALVMLNYAGLAELRLQQERFEEVTRYSNYVLASTRQLDDHYMAGEVYFSIAKVTLDMATRVEEAQQSMMHESALEIFQRAEKYLKESHAHMTLVDLYERWARLLERLGRGQEAINCWRSAYDMLNMAKMIQCPPSVFQVI